MWKNCSTTQAVIKEKNMYVGNIQTWKGKNSLRINWEFGVVCFKINLLAVWGVLNYLI